MEWPWTVRIRLGWLWTDPDPTCMGHGPPMDRIWIGFGRGWIGFGTDWIGFGPPSDTQVIPMLPQCGSKLTKGDFQLPNVTPMLHQTDPVIKSIHLNQLGK